MKPVLLTEKQLNTPEIYDSISKTYGLYYTRQKLADFCVKLFPGRTRSEMRILEPSAGRGSFVQAFYSGFEQPKIFANDLLLNNTKHLEKRFPGRSLRIYSMDYEDLRFKNKFDYIGGNPPYLLAENHIRHSFTQLKDGGYLGFLLRLNFLGSKERIDFWKNFKPMIVYSLSERPGFLSEVDGDNVTESSNNSTDMTEYAFYIWQKGWMGRTELEVVSWGGPDKVKK